MKLGKLLSTIREGLLQSSPPDCDRVEISGLSYDSRTVSDGHLFFAIKGLQLDGHDYLPEVIESGAAAVVSEQAATSDSGPAWIQVRDIRQSMALIASEFFGHPSRQMQLVGITGTNGKTTTANLIHSVLNPTVPSVMMGTVTNRIGDAQVPSTMTTPESVDIQRNLREALDQGCRAGVMEVSSHALYFNRVFQCRFPIAVFTNLGRDHLDFHPSREAYFETKQLFFDRSCNPALRWALVNFDDTFGRRLQVSPAAETVRFGLDSGYDVYPNCWQSSASGTSLDLQFKGRRLALRSRLVGKYNVYNLMAAASSCLLLGIPESDVCRRLSECTAVPGRFEKVDLGAPFTAIIDYAHTPDAFDNVLDVARQLTGGRVICLFGCGGGKDTGKRPLMGAVAAEKADFVILTSDNPRDEDPEEITEQIVAGFPDREVNYAVLLDRREAIFRAVEMAKPGDLVLLLGKGHENYQEIQGHKMHFDEREILKEAI